MKTYDILNAGSKNRFMVNGRIVSNSGRIVQIQNLPQNHINDIEVLRNVIKDRDIEGAELLFGDIPQLLSELIRTAFVAKAGYTFVVADFSAIEARVIAWLAGEKWRLDVFKGDGKIYEASASKMFGIPIEEITKESDARRNGKVTELSCGFAGGVGALKQMGAEKYGITEEEMQELITAWRQASPNIVKLWYNIERACINAIKGNPSQMGSLKFYTKDKCLMVVLPSGRSLVYRDAAIEPHPKFEGKEAIVFNGMNQTTKTWEKQSTYGGKLAENCTQAVARDCLADLMLRIPYTIVGHVHDEVILEVKEEEAESVLEDVKKLMAVAPKWGVGLPLGGEGYITPFYKKD